ncbi:histone-lysine N-methyltransferase, H3 lysine-79 specific [Anopheles darlingi]|uniref:histone-lysine N-methyltransferase, H3 lysine-79 specific n=1 Tax=Anopheles darlingi TaxID=43151 RepID=UPI00210028FF|nr:histone-lysine N-methyltransferase, H3 lysine-79 specific [Anopheles darlingi]
MDELMEMFNSFIGEALLSEQNMEEEFKELERKINQCVKQATERGTPVQNKKRPKRHASISEKDERDANSTVTNDGRSSSGRGSANRMLDVAPSDELMAGEEPAAAAAVMPPPPAPVAAVEKAARPSRTARLKAQEKLKEPSLVEKMRNPNTSIKVKIERSSTIANSSTLSNDKSHLDSNLHKTPSTFDEMEVENDANRMNRMDNVVPPIDEGLSTNDGANKEGKPKNTTSNHRDSGEEEMGKASLMVIQPTVPKVEIVSDEEMPPPKMPAPKPAAPRTGRGRGRPPKASKTKSTIQPDEDTMGIVEPIRVKTEKLSIVESAESTFTITQPPLRQLNVVLENMAIPKGTPPQATAKSTPGMRTPDYKGTDLEKTAGTPPPATTTSPGMGIPDANGTYLVEAAFPKGTLPQATEMGPGSGTPDPNGTFAISTSSSGNNRCLPSVQDGTFVIEKNDSSSEPNPSERMHLVNASIMTEDDSVVENSPHQQPTFAGPAAAYVKPSFSKATTEAKTKKASTTGTLKKSSSTNALGSNRNATAALADAGKKHKELFNPCVQSPIKSRIEAFEKCAFGSTMTTKAASGTPQVARIYKTVSTPTMTPHSIATLDAYGAAGVRSANAARPMGNTVTTPNITTQPITKASSASKISQMRNKMLQHYTHSVAANGGAGVRGPQSLSRESSWDRAATVAPSTSGGTLSAASSTSSLLDEKKKKREEKQRIAAEQREAKEREKREHMERLRREKEEKYQKLLLEKQEKIRLDAAKKARKLEEFEKRRQQEEQRALADQKRDELAKQLEQQRIDRELLETLKHSQMKENNEIKLQKQMHQQKLRQQQQAAAAAAAKKKAATGSGRRVQQFTFDMIETDDSTDEDEPTDPSKKNKRPPLPEWCKNEEQYRKELMIQSKVDTKVIDRLFSVQPTTPDLRELFPSIDAHKLKRNSSAIWRTPPRPSQIP